MSAHNSERVSGTSGPTKPRASATHQALETLVGRKRRSSRAPKTSLFEVPVIRAGTCLIQIVSHCAPDVGGRHPARENQDRVRGLPLLSQGNRRAKIGRPAMRTIRKRSRQHRRGNHSPEYCRRNSTQHRRTFVALALMGVTKVSTIGRPGVSEFSHRSSSTLADVAVGSNATGSMRVNARLMSAPLRLRPKWCDAAKCRNGPIAVIRPS